MTITMPGPEAAGQRQRPEHRSAVLFISGLGGSGASPTAESVASRIGHALNWAARDRKATFAVLPDARQEKLPGGAALERATVRRDAADGPGRAVDVWLLATADELVGDYEQASLHVKLLRGARVFVRYSRKAQILLRKGTPAKTARERAQLMVVRAMIVLLGAYLLGLCVALLGEIAGFDWVPGWASGAVLAVTGLGIWQSKRIKNLTKVVVQMHCLLDYVGEGEKLGTLRANVSNTLEHLAEQTDVEYDQTDVIAYSFGSVVALDAFFPRSNQPGPGFADVAHLITIGCPYDLLRTYWPAYYTERHRRRNAPKRWVNVYSPRDVFGSNFVANDDSPLGISLQGQQSDARPHKSLPWVTVAEDAEDVGVLQILGFPGLKAHGAYWDTESEHDESVFSEIVTTLYKGKPLLA